MEDEVFHYNKGIEKGLACIYRLLKRSKIILIISICFCIILISILICITFNHKNKLANDSSRDKKQTLNLQHIPTKDIYGFLGNKYHDINYDENGIIKNSFKLRGDNYDENIGEINNGLDYDKNERNKYDLYIPQTALDRKNDINGILLWIHGGAWTGGRKEHMEQICNQYSKQGYITVTFGYTILSNLYTNYNIYRILDEITACIKSIKIELIKLGFKEDKLLLGIGGISAGAHLALLYSYLIKDINIIPIKFIVNIVGPIGLNEKYFLKVKSNNDTLENIEDISIIEKALQDRKIVPYISLSSGLKILNAFYGGKFTNKELTSMLFENGTLNYDNEKFKEMFKVIKNSYVTEIEDKHKIPTICVYGGIDNAIGVSTFAYLKEKMDKDGRPYDFIYSRYEGHNLLRPKTKDGKEKYNEVIFTIKKYLIKYFGY